MYLIFIFLVFFLMCTKKELCTLGIKTIFHHIFERLNFILQCIEYKQSVSIGTQLHFFFLFEKPPSFLFLFFHKRIFQHPVSQVIPFLADFKIYCVWYFYQTISF